MSPLDGADLRFRNPQLYTSYKTMDTGLVHRVVCMFISQPKLVLIYGPRRDERLS